MKISLWNCLLFLLPALAANCGQSTTSQELLEANFSPAPSIIELSTLLYDKLLIRFSQEMDQATMGTLSNYRITRNGGADLAIQGFYSLQTSAVIIKTAPQESLAPYELLISGVKNKINKAINAETRRSFVGFNSSGGTFVDMLDGTVYNSALNAFFQKCSIGQLWDANSNSCTASVTAGNYCSTSNNDCNNGVSSGLLTFPFLGGASSAAYSACNTLNSTPSSGFANRTKWRVPKIEELITLVRMNLTPSIDSALFPSTSTSNYWSATGLSFLSSQAYVVNFGSGTTSTAVKNNVYNIRCISDN